MMIPPEYDPNDYFRRLREDIAEAEEERRKENVALYGILALIVAAGVILLFAARHL